MSTAVMNISSIAGDRHNCDRYAPSTHSCLMKRSHHALDFIKGHYDCGAIRASTSRQDLGELFLSLVTVLLCSPLPLCDTSGLLENWLRLIRDVYRLHKDYLDLIEVNLMIVDICCSDG
jgi:hypothetical protein